MNVAFGLKAHSGWAALVVLGKGDGERRRRRPAPHRARRGRVGEAAVSRGRGLKPDAARDLVKRGVEAAHRNALREIRAAVKRERERDNEVTACAVLVGAPMPDWSDEEILAVHFRMHKAEGVLFREALVGAAEACGLRLVAIPEKLLTKHAEKALGTPASGLAKRIAALGKSVGPPWGKDQKDAALAALVALRGRGSDALPRARLVADEDVRLDVARQQRDLVRERRGEDLRAGAHLERRDVREGLPGDRCRARTRECRAARARS